MTKRKKAFIIIAVVILFIVATIMVFNVVNENHGNPLSRYLAKKGAENYLDLIYPEEGYEIDTVRYNVNTKDYLVEIGLENSKDIHFTLMVSMSGTVRGDDYEFRVTERNNTLDRLNSQYRQMTAKVFDDEFFPYDGDVMYGTLSAGGDTGKSWKLMLTLDREYDIEILGKQRGYLIIYLKDTDISYTHIGEILVNIKEAFDEADVGFYALDFCIEQIEDDDPDTDDGVLKKVKLSGFKRSDITQQGIELKIANAAVRQDV